ncbi:hypothetical protein IEU95_04830 [Hoyosella rhizosphaerae]|uniref:Uncharacterized protein n=1 Tax=Hoyosella rhizosphaerae TaxID=1755582 RepID=A0A916XE43_9ACTN|nr:hypothetical protein [Hoyosella rhizosphaerae]MBN4926142.1 hypothetical protein [Hoyosella rhizosphaerae]GGC65208.1 hypothetical protein GCM10011410_17120 [Hoyosella rhizosphaerae]
MNDTTRPAESKVPSLYRFSPGLFIAGIAALMVAVWGIADVGNGASSLHFLPWVLIFVALTLGLILTFAPNRTRRQ